MMNPPKVIGEIGINHNGSVDTAMQLCSAIKQAGGDYAKFQMRTPEICVPESERGKLRQTPWGEMTYFDYKKRMEFTPEQYTEIESHCINIGLKWSASYVKTDGTSLTP